MWRLGLITSVFIVMLAFPAFSQSLTSLDQNETKDTVTSVSGNPFMGKWSYRSFHNNPDLAIPFNDLRFGAGTLEITQVDLNQLHGILGGDGWSLTLTGWTTYGSPPVVRFQGKGTVNGEEWIYDYVGYLMPHWPNGQGQRPAIVGTIVRTIPHSNGQSKAGYVASWIAVKQD